MADKIGAFDTKIEYYQHSVSRGTHGEKVEAYTLLSAAFASVERQQTNEVSDENDNDTVTLILKCYKKAAVTTRTMVKYKNEMYSIQNIDGGSRLSPYMTLQIRRDL